MGHWHPANEQNLKIKKRTMLEPMMRMCHEARIMINLVLCTCEPKKGRHEAGETREVLLHCFGDGLML
jgi:hypothetical protein